MKRNERLAGNAVRPIGAKILDVLTPVAVLKGGWLYLPLDHHR